MCVCFSVCVCSEKRSCVFSAVIFQQGEQRPWSGTLVWSCTGYTELIQLFEVSLSLTLTLGNSDCAAAHWLCNERKPRVTPDRLVIHWRWDVIWWNTQTNKMISTAGEVSTPVPEPVSHPSGTSQWCALTLKWCLQILCCLSFSVLNVSVLMFCCTLRGTSSPFWLETLGLFLWTVSKHTDYLIDEISNKTTYMEIF